jgi:hypothetical protein
MMATKAIFYFYIFPPQTEEFMNTKIMSKGKLYLSLGSCIFIDNFAINELKSLKNYYSDRSPI